MKILFVFERKGTLFLLYSKTIIRKNAFFYLLAYNFGS